MNASNSLFHRLVWPASLLDRDEVEKLSKSELTFRLEHLPALISDRSIEANHAKVRNHAVAKLRDGHTPLAETIPMPRAVTGDRPILYTDITTRLAYNSLVAMIKPSLESNSRASVKRRKFAEFGTEPGEYVVISDVAACYEYVAPGLLADEILLRSDDHVVSQALRELLTALAVRDRGMPQMMDASDRLVDVYLAIADRTLDREGLPYVRTADDYKIVVDSWVEANRALEVLERALRDLGLTLSIHKTKIVQSGHGATTTPSGSDFDSFETGEDQTDEPDEPDEPEVDPAEGYLSWHLDWKKERGKDLGVRKLLPPPPPQDLDQFGDLGSLNPELLADLVFASPPHLESVLLLLGRKPSGVPQDPELIDKVLVKLCQAHRGNAWSTLWLLTTAETLWANGLPKTSDGSKELVKLARAALEDQRETVRAEAAWALAQASDLTIGALRKLHVAASSLTEPGIAAAAAYVKATKRGGDAKRFDRVRASIVASRPLNEAAAAWGHAAGAAAVAPALPTLTARNADTSPDTSDDSKATDSGESSNAGS